MRTIPTPTPADLKATFEQLARHSYGDIDGVMCFDSGRDGPTVGITVCTHGNEPAGLAAVWYYTQVAPLQEQLKKGRVFFVLNNIQATSSFFHATTDIHRRNARFVDINMNRLPADMPNYQDPLEYEISRAQQLLPVWAQFDIGLDIHSTSQPAPPMIVADHQLDFNLIAGFPIDKLLTNILHVMKDKSALEFYGHGKHCHAIAIETGQHDEAASWATAITCTKALLHNAGVTNGHDLEKLNEFDHYHVENSVFFPDESYELTKIFANFAAVKRGETLANGQKGAIHAPMDGHVLMCPSHTKPLSIAEEILFLSRPVERLSVEG